MTDVESWKVRVVDEKGPCHFDSLLEGLQSFRVHHLSYEVGSEGIFREKRCLFRSGNVHQLLDDSYQIKLSLSNFVRFFYMIFYGAVDFREFNEEEVVEGTEIRSLHVLEAESESIEAPDHDFPVLELELSLEVEDHHSQILVNLQVQGNLGINTIQPFCSQI